MADRTINLALAFHNHQPVGNFPHIFEMAYEKCYLPFLDAFEKHSSLAATFHYSGCLLEWIEEAHPEYIERLRGLVQAGRIELMGGGFYEPILVMLTDEDRHDQIRMMTDYLSSKLDARVQGAWVPERVWEQSLACSLAEAGIDYIILDDFHFKNAGLLGDDLLGYYLTEDRGRLLRVFPSSELLRYYIPFKWPEELIAHLQELATEDGTRLLVYGDDGEKFGVWPETYEHVYGDRWLERFFKALEENREWIRLMTLSQAMERVEPLGKIYLPDASYREMTEWALPEPAQERYGQTAGKLEEAGLYDEAKVFMRGGFWRNFKIKYPETNRMYGKMLCISRKIRAISRRKKKRAEAQQELFRGQCNCPYWHGVFGGLYLPHLRWAIYEHLIAAEAMADEMDHDRKNWVTAEELDVDLDARDEVLLGNSHIKTAFKPDTGGHLIAFDSRAHRINLLNLVARWPEAYHAHLLEAAQASEEHGEDVKSIHHITACKQPGLDKKLQYDSAPRDSLVDRFLPQGYSLDDAVQGRSTGCGDFVSGPYDAEIGHVEGGVVLTMRRDGRTDTGQAMSVTKSVRLMEPDSGLQVDYTLRNTDSAAVAGIFAVEHSIAMLSDDETTRFYRLDPSEPAMPLTHEGSFLNRSSVVLRDLQLGTDVVFEFSLPCEVWAFPIQTVSQSESGFELVYQGSCILPRWPISLDPGKAWTVTLRMEIRPIA